MIDPPRGESAARPEDPFATNIPPYNRRRLWAIVLLSASVMMVVLVVAWPQFRAGSDRVIGRTSDPPPAAEPTGSTEAASDTVVKASYSGLNEQGRPFTITAKQLVTSPTDPRRIDLTQPTAELVMRPDRRLSLVADSGVYDKDANAVELIGNVVLVDNAGNQVTTSRAMIELVESSAAGNEPVRAEGRMGWVTGTGFRVSEKDDRLLVLGPARLVLNGAQPNRNAQ